MSSRIARVWKQRVAQLFEASVTVSFIINSLSFYFSLFSQSVTSPRCYPPSPFFCWSDSRSNCWSEFTAYSAPLLCHNPRGEAWVHSTLWVDEGNDCWNKRAVLLLGWRGNLCQVGQTQMLCSPCMLPKICSCGSQSKLRFSTSIPNDWWGNFWAWNSVLSRISANPT